MLNLYTEEFTNKSIENISDILLEKIENNNYDFLVILPNRRLITYLRNKILKKVPAVYNLKIYTFDDVINKGNLKNINDRMEDEVQKIVVKLAINRCIENNKLPDNNFYKSDGFFNICFEYINMLKGSLKSNIDFEEEIPQESSLYSISICYKEYEKILKENSIQDKYDFYKYILQNDDLKGVKDIYIDGFFEFRSIEYKIIEKLAEDNKNVNIYLHNSRVEDFSIIKETLDNLKRLGFKENTIQSKKNNFQYLSTTLFSSKDYSCDSDIKIVKCDDSYLEVKKLMLEIKRDIQKGIDFKDITILVNNKNEFLKELILSLEEENIPYEKNIEQSLLDYKLFSQIKEIMCLDCTVREYLTSLLEFSDIFKFDEDMVYSLKRHISSINLNTFDDYKNLKVLKDDINYYNYLEIINKIETVYNSILSGNNFEIIKNIKKVTLDRINLKDENKIIDYELSLFYKSAENFLELLERLESQYRNLVEEMNSEDFINIMTLIISSYKISENLNNDKGVKIQDTTTMRLLNTKNIYILGMNENNFPSKKNYNFFYNEANVDILKNIGIDILSQKDENIRDLLRFLLAISTAENKLYLSYNTEDDELQSKYIDEIKSKAEVVEENYDIKSYLKPSKEEISTINDFKRFISSYNLDDIDDEKINDIFNSDIVKIKSNFKNRESDILFNDETLKKHKLNFENHRYSVSQLETYQRCPQQYYYKYVLKVKEIYTGDKSFEMRSIGTVFHEVLEKYYRFYKEDNIKKIDTRNNIELSNIEEAFLLDRFKEGFLNLGYSIMDAKVKNYIYVYEKLAKDLIEKDILYLSLYNRKFYPEEFEKKFEIILDDFKSDKSIKLHGFIDRIDMDNSGNKILVDYKLGKSSGKSLGDFEKDKTLQFPIYSFVKNVVGCKYMTMRGSNISEFFIMDDFASKYSNAKSVLDLEARRNFEKLTKEKVFTIVKDIEDAKFNIGTEIKDDCKICDYRKICEYRRGGAI